ncbi:MAG: hypothetical protein ABSG52_16790 [Terriglobales bacterium]
MPAAGAKYGLCASASTKSHDFYRSVCVDGNYGYFHGERKFEKEEKEENFRRVERPLVIIFGVLAGGYIAGIAGSFLSVPVLATLRIVYRQLQKRPRDSRLRSPGTGMV